MKLDLNIVSDGLSAAGNMVYKLTLKSIHDSNLQTNTLDALHSMRRATKNPISGNEAMEKLKSALGPDMTVEQLDNILEKRYGHW